MKRILLSFCILLITVWSYAQGNSSIDLSVGSGYSFRSLSDPTSSTVSAPLFQSRNENEESRQNWNITIAYNRALSKNLFFKTGLKYNSYTYYTLKLTGLQWPTQHDGMGGFDPTSALEANDLYYSDAHRFIGIPLFFRYQLNNRKLHPFVELGTSFNYYLTTTTTREGGVNNELNSSESSHRDDYTSLNLFGHISLGANYNCTESIQVYGQVACSRQLNSLTDTPFREHLYDYSIQLGIRKAIGSPQSAN